MQPVRETENYMIVFSDGLGELVWKTESDAPTTEPESIQIVMPGEGECVLILRCANEQIALLDLETDVIAPVETNGLRIPYLKNCQLVEVNVDKIEYLHTRLARIS